jgi:hypothetical protein
VRNLVGGNVLSTVQTYGDLAFYKLQLERLDLDDPAALENAIKESSAKELRGLIERITFCTLVAVMRQSGTDASSGQGRRRYWNFLFETSLQ